MKNYFLILALCCAVAFVCCKKDEMEIIPQIPEDMEEAFPDPLFREYVLKNFDTNGDGRISGKEALAITEIEVGNFDNRNDESKLIKSLEGIQYFSNLTDLDCSWNQLISLDVSKNTKLTVLDCYGNQLTTLDVSKNTKLETLYFFQNHLTTLDVSKNTKLTKLSCYNNQLTTLNVSGCTHLTRLDCFRNRLTALDVSKNTQLEYLNCSYNQLTALDVSKNTQLTYLWCYENQLTTLDVSKTNLGNSTWSYPLYCPSTLKTLYLKEGWSIRGITDDNGRSSDYIPEQTQIIFVD